MNHVQRLRGMLGLTGTKSLVSLVDQAIISGLNFTIAFVLARTGSQEEYGSFALAFSILLFVNGVSYTLISTPMMVLGATKQGKESQEYFSAMLLSQVVVSLCCTFVVSMIVLFLYLRGSGSIFVGALIGMAICIPSVQVQDFLRRALLTRLQTGQALRNDALLCGLQLAGLWILFMNAHGARGHVGMYQDVLSAKNAFLIIAGSSTMALVIGFLQFRKIIGLRLSNVRTYARENWDYAKWGVISMIGGAATLHATTWIVGMIGGEMAVAEVEAPRLLAGFMNVLVFGLANVFTPRTAAIYEQQKARGLKNFLKKSYLLWGVICGMFFAVMLMFGKEALGFAFGGRYADLSNILYMWVGYYIVVGLRQVPGYGISAIRRPDIGVWIGLFVGIVTLVLTTVLMHFGGVAIVVAGRIAGETLTLLLLHGAVFSLLGQTPHVQTKSKAE